MRPRLLHLGSRQAAPAGGLLGVRFNEAEAFTPRIRDRADRLFRNKNERFNEAEAFTPRIRPPTGWRGRGGRRFNEAEAFTPRIPLCFDIIISQQHAASMRPRLLHLGSSIAFIWFWEVPACFNEAEAFTPRIRENTGG